ncbi:MAG TPA: dienelactone hydrolase family protein [Candidatus Paceibacterota bacterium]|nr:dienelactone hydrolase family protein [Candidatus Paceibacterota bacterium]
MLKYVGFALVAIILVLSGYHLILSQQQPVPSGGEEMAVRGEFVNYFENRQGYYAEPVAGGNYPGVIMVHEWWGLNDNIAGMAEELAAQGYRVLAVDLFGTVAATSSEAQRQVAALDQAKAIENMKTAERYLRDRGSQRIASLGWCFGGAQSLQLALSESEELDATVIYYGTLTDDRNRLQNISWPVLGVFGAEDQSISTSSVTAFENALNELGIENEIYVYPGVGHAFANPSNPNYAPRETADAWAKTLAFLEQHLK